MAYARLDAMRDDANSMLGGVLDLGKGGTFQSRTERDVIVRTAWPAWTNSTSAIRR